MALAPILLFSYARPHHVKRTIEALKANFLAKESKLIIFQDGLKEGHSEKEKENHERVSNIIDSVDYFKDVIVIKRPFNYGLAENIVQGVSEIASKYGRVIVLEDDLVTSPLFLRFMNKYLDSFANNDHIFHINAYNNYIGWEWLVEDLYTTRFMDCWGWATWETKWRNYENDLEKNFELLKRKTTKFKFNYYNSIPLWEQIEANINGTLHTWAIRWYLSIFLNEGLCIQPKYSFVNNIGTDGTGQNYNTKIKNLSIKLASELPPRFTETKDYESFNVRLYTALTYRSGQQKLSPKEASLKLLNKLANLTRSKNPYS
jgi:hypothetical protein